MKGRGCVCVLGCVSWQLNLAGKNRAKMKGMSHMLLTRGEEDTGWRTWGKCNLRSCVLQVPM